MEPRTFEIDRSVQWGCSMQGWNCCVDRGIPVRPYDMLRLRHALGRPSHELVGDQTVTFTWDPDGGALLGMLAHRPYEAGRLACTFFEEITNAGARAMRRDDPARFATMPPQVRRAADSTAAGERRVAGLCGVHGGRPEACRAFPFEPVMERAHAGAPTPTMVRQVHDCGSCALSTTTTPREVLAGQDIEPYWRASDDFSRVERYLRSLGLANVKHDRYRTFPVRQVVEFWEPLYLPDSHEGITSAFPEQWRRTADREGDAIIHRMLLEDAMNRADRAVAESARPPSSWGFANHDVARPNLDQAFDPGVPALPPSESERWP